MYKVNDTVLYSIHNVCRIEDITSKDIMGKNTDYYVLKPIFDNKSKILIPVDNEKLTSKMRYTLSKEEILSLIEEMAEAEIIWMDDDKERKEKYIEILSRGDRKELIIMIKTLYLRRKELANESKKLHVADEHFFKEAEDLLYNEFSYVLQMKREEILPFIFSKVQEVKSQ